MTRSRQEAIRWGRNQIDHPSQSWDGLCLQFVRSCFDIGPRDFSAAEAWENARYKHPTENEGSIPRGVPAFWTGGSQGFGHIVLSVGGGMCLTNDFVRQGKINRASIQAISNGWGQNFRGWSEDLNGVRIFDPMAGKEATGFDRVRETAVRPGKKNNDVFAVKRALVAKLGKDAASILGGDGKDYFGDGMRADVRKFQHRIGFTGAAADGIPGRTTLRRLGLQVVD